MHYLGDLYLEISNILKLLPCWNFTNVIELTFKVEKQQKEVKSHLAITFNLKGALPTRVLLFSQYLSYHHTDAFKETTKQGG